jgi:putative tricarboxylic transport membrane protein
VLEPMLDGLLLFTPTTILWMVFGILFTTVVAVIPGLGGVFAMAIMLPLMFTIPPEAGLAMLMAAVAVEGTGNTVTGVLFGVPGSATGVATVLDGYPMAQKGEGARGVAAGLTASVTGGLFGAFVLALILPFMRPIVLALGPPEFFTMILAAVVLMAFVSEGSRLKSITAGMAGLLLSFVGMEMSTGTTRYVFGQVYLWDGLRLVPVTIGLFAVAEIIGMLTKGRSIAGASPSSSAAGQVLQGMKDVFVKWRITLQSSLVGVIVGAAPGVGGAAAQFLAYTQAMKTSPRGKYYGTGEVEGVIAADAATNAKDGGSLVPALGFGIPGTASTALLLVGMVSVGVQPGAAMLNENLSLTWMFVWILVFANVIAGAMLLASTGFLAKLTHVSPSVLAPPIWAVSLLGAYATSRHMGDILTVIAFGFIGVAMMRHGYSRATFIIGFVLGLLMERYYLLAMRLHGWEFLLRPVVLGILGLLAAVLVLPLSMRLVRATRRPRPRKDAGVR